ncbi:putative addiction module antidote protein [Limnohabitans sp. JirII-29]|jgi:probable addiction module antidote protein|uniref:addiction module antidote protein n=1 Tax=unclassified Limnohabitans TaxID=2626134 RepID=UPI000C1E5464|nr:MULTISPECIES: addiction module antidote protein [unclassified Limnohabitans]PIT76739.1 putative addiction module antidote protein [Limnohabitans sp. JirII-31]PUE30017.1 putative addiction module antidote protein [Limnohabitans sp. JirII-29]
MSKTIEFDAASYLDSEDMIAQYLNLAFESGDTDLLLLAIGDIAKARGMTQVAIDSGLGRESLYKALRAGSKPRFDTMLKVMHALGVRIQAYSVETQ